MNSEIIASDILVFRSYGIKKIEYEATPPQLLGGEENTDIDIKMDFCKNIEILNTTDFKVELGVKINGVNTKGEKVVFINVCMDGFFSVKSAEQVGSHANINSVSILFPYLRTAVSTFTILSNYGEITLPPMNIIRWFELEK